MTALDRTHDTQPHPAADDRCPAVALTALRLVAAQFPQWADLPVTPAPGGGWDNATFRLGHELKIRLPTAARYAGQPEREHRWLPELAPALPLPIPRPVALGAPGCGHPWPWAVQSWLSGAPAPRAEIADLAGFATDLAAFLAALRRAPAAGGPSPGPENLRRGGDLAAYDGETRACLAALEGDIDAEAARRVWRAARASRFDGPPVWVHGDLAPGNLLALNGRLSAVIDFGACAVGDPACDLAIAWTFLDDPARAAFRAALADDGDGGAWARARGWALWKALLILAGQAPQPPLETPAAEVVALLLAEGD